MIERVYTDGGLIIEDFDVIGQSRIGGAWAWIAVDRTDRIVTRQRGLIFVHSEGLGATIVAHQIELYAVVRALEAMDDGWQGTLYTDSLQTWQRLMGTGDLKTVPVDLRLRFEAQRRRFSELQAVRCKGHATKDELIDGVTATGVVTSRFNSQCDRDCRRLVAEYRASHGSGY